MLLLLDAQGVVVAIGGDAATTASPPWLDGLRAGVALPARLQALARSGDADAQALQHGLQALLARRQPVFEHHGPLLQAHAELLTPPSPVAAVLMLDADATARAECERLRSALRTAERRLAAVQDAAGLGTWYADLGRGQAQYAPQTYRLLRRDPARGPLQGPELQARLHPDELPSMLALLERVRAGAPTVSARFRLRCDDGVERWFETSAALEPEEPGHTRGIVGTLRDVSELMRAQHELERHRERLEDLVVSRTVQLAEASQRAEAAGRARSTFLAQTSHELRTPLNVIVSLAHLMRRSMPDAAASGRVQAIEQAARQLGEIVDQALEQAHRADDAAARSRALDAAAPAADVRAAASATPADELPSAQALRRRHGGRRVLVAEDDEVNQLALLELLADVGLLVDTADDGRDAVDQAALRAYALILLDLRMPRLDGLAAARAIRALPGHQATPLIAISANTFDEDRQACRAAGMNEFLPKPIEVGRLYDTLLHWLDHSAGSWPPPAVPPRSEAAPPLAGSGGITPLLGLEGIDAVGGLASVGGREEVYRRLLGMFARTHGDDGSRLHEVLNAGDAERAAGLMHRIRGSAATLGLVDVETTVAQLERALEAGGPAAAAGEPMRAFDAALAGTVAQLEAALKA